MIRVLLALLISLLAPAWAHKPSDAYLLLRPDGARVDVRWDIALRDLDVVVGLDTDGDGSITWGEVRARHQDIASHALARLTLAADGAACTFGAVDHVIDRHSDGAYAVLRFAATCPAAPTAIEVTYRLLAGVDPQHRGLLSVVLPGGTRSAVLGPDAPRIAVPLAGDTGPVFRQFLTEGVVHILTGFDHLFFIAVLLLPAMLRRRDGVWQPVDRFRDGLLETVKILSAFSAAHTITVALAALQIVEPPSRMIEAAIALTIGLTALDLIVPFLGPRRWLVAGAFGLIHGFGFAGALGPLALPAFDLAVALIAFNLGVEAGQLMVALLVLPISYTVRHRPFYPRLVVPAGSAAAIAVSLLWFAERTFALPAWGRGLLPF